MILSPHAAVAKLVLGILVLGLVGCGPETTQHPPVEQPAPKAHWFSSAYLNGTSWELVCDDTQKIIGTVRNPEIQGSGNWQVFGGDGNGYGEYKAVEPAKRRVEEITGASWQTSNLDHCP